MFTGLVQGLGRIGAIERSEDGARLTDVIGGEARRAGISRQCATLQWREQRLCDTQPLVTSRGEIKSHAN